MASNQSRREQSQVARVGRGRLGRAAIATVALSFAAEATQAANYYWDPTLTASTAGGGAGTWDSTTPDWYTGAADAVWAAGNTAIFGNVGGAVGLGAPESALNLQFTGSGYTVAPTATNTLTLTGGFGITAATIANSTVYSGGAGTNSVGGPITIAATGASVAYLSAAAGSTLNLTGTIAENTIATTGLTIFGPGTVNYSGTALTPGKFNVQGGTTFNSSGAMTISANGTYTGVSDTALSTWNVTGGSITAATTLFLGNGTNTSGAFNVSGGTATFTGGAINVGDSFNNGGDGVGTLTLSGAGLLSTGTAAGNLRLGNTKGGQGTLNLNGGTLSTNYTIAKGSSAVGAGTGAVSVVNFNGGTLQATGTALSVANTLTANVLDGGLIVDTNGGAAAIAANLLSGGTGVGGVTKNGVGVLTLSGANTFGGNVAVNNGTLAITSATAIPNFAKVGVASGAYLSFGLPAFAAADITTAQGQVAFASGSGIGLDVATGTQTYTGNLTNAFTNFIKTGAGTLTLAGTDTYTGTTTIAQGILAQPSIASLGSTSGLVLGSGANTGTFQYAGAGETITLPITLGGTTGGGAIDSSGTGPITVSSAINVTAAGAKTLTLTGSNAGANTLASTVANGSGTVALAKTGVGTWVVSGPNTFTGAVAVNAGTLNAASNSALGTGTVTIGGAGTTSTATGGTLALSGGITLANPFAALAARNDPGTTTSTPEVENVSGSNSISSNLVLGAGGAGSISQSDAGTLTYTGTIQNTSASSYTRPFYITGAGNTVLAGNLLAGTGNTATVTTNGLNVVKYGTGTATLSGAANTFFGGITVNAGTVALITAPGTGAIVNNANLAFVNAAALNLGQVISGSGTVQQTGASTTTLTGANTYTGATTVNNTAGTLSVKYSSTGTSASSPLLTGPGGADIQNGAVVFDYTGDTTPAATIRGALVTAYANGFQSGQLRSSTANANRGLGYLDDGASSVKVKATLYGDVNLDGSVLIDDFNVFASNFNTVGGQVWGSGDFNYDGNVQIDDFNLLAANYNQSVGAAGPTALSAADWAPLIRFAIAHDDLPAFEAATGVPEPTTLAALAVAGGVLGGTRRRRRRTV